MPKIKDKHVVLIFTAIPIIVIVTAVFVTGLSSHYPEPPKIISAIIWLLIIAWLVCLFYLIIRFVAWVLRFSHRFFKRP